MYPAYRSASQLIAPLLPWWLDKRRKRGKEDAARMGERLGIPGQSRPPGTLFWVHAASVGEANAALPLIEALLARDSALQVLLTTGTLTSAKLMAGRLPPRALHQFVPVDTPHAVRRFMLYWKPDIGLFIDSELWPNLIMQAHRQGVVLALANARMSPSSFRLWKRYAPWLMRSLLKCFSYCFAQSAQDALRLQKLGLPLVNHIGNLKYDVPPLSCDGGGLERLRGMIGDRPVWVAASTHPGEEEILAQVHSSVKQSLPDVLTIIVPRHAARAEVIMAELSGLNVAQRSRQMPITDDTDIYLADTMGELGLFYRLAQVAFIGGSLVAHGGQNPIEALKLGCPVITGPHMENFQAVMDEMMQARACLRVDDPEGLVKTLVQLLGDAAACKALADAGRAHADDSSGSLEAMVSLFSPLLA